MAHLWLRRLGGLGPCLLLALACNQPGGSSLATPGAEDESGGKPDDASGGKPDDAAADAWAGATDPPTAGTTAGRGGAGRGAGGHSSMGVPAAGGRAATKPEVEAGAPGAGQAGELGEAGQGGAASDDPSSLEGGAPNGSAGTPQHHAGEGGAAGTVLLGGAGGVAMGGAGGVAMGDAGAVAMGGTAGTASGGQGPGPTCSFTLSATVSPNIPTVGAVDWTTTLTDLTSARVVYTLDDAEPSTLNRGGTAPVDVTESSHHTLLLGLKPGRTYAFHVEVEAPGVTCQSDEQTLTTGALADAPAIERYAADPNAQAGGFIVTSGGFGSTGPALIIDADGTVVWTAPAPPSCSRARLDFEGKNLWMIAANASNAGGELRYVSLDGEVGENNLSGFSRAHHDFTALPGGRIAAFSWQKSGFDPPSDLLVRDPDGSVEVLFPIGANLYEGGPSAFGGSSDSYHCNSVSYHPADGSFTIGDRNPSVFVKVSGSGVPEWQFGGSCAQAKAPRCASGSWEINHGHQLLADGTFLFFNNTGMRSTTPSAALEFTLTDEPMGATPRSQWSGSASEHSDTLGDVQRLPNGNTLVTFSNNGIIYELDASWALVQTLKAASFGYSEWRPTLYGPPAR